MHYPKSSLTVAIIALFLVLVIDILVSNVISLEDNKKLLLVSAEQLTISNIINNNTNNNSQNIKKSLLVKNNQKFRDYLKKNDESFQDIADQKSGINSDNLDNKLLKNQLNEKIYLIHQELPKIPDELRYNNFHIHALARLQINNNGIVYGVKLIEPTNNVLINKLLVASLYKWRFGGVNSDITKDIRVDFAVE